MRLLPTAPGHIRQRFPSEEKVVPDPVTGIPLAFPTSTAGGGSKIYQISVARLTGSEVNHAQ